jgi:hypothetical protein
MWKSQFLSELTFLRQIHLKKVVNLGSLSALRCSELGGFPPFSFWCLKPWKCFRIGRHRVYSRGKLLFSKFHASVFKQVFIRCLTRARNLADNKKLRALVVAPDIGRSPLRSKGECVSNRRRVVLERVQHSFCPNVHGESGGAAGKGRKKRTE